MRKIAALILVFAFLMPVLAHAEDMILNTKVERVSSKINKDGNPYVIIFVQEERTLSGIAYTAEAPVFAFGASRNEASQVKEGETMKAIVSKRDNGGDTTYTLRKIIR